MSSFAPLLVCVVEIWTLGWVRVPFKVSNTHADLRRGYLCHPHPTPQCRGWIMSLLPGFHLAYSPDYLPLSLLATCMLMALQLVLFEPFCLGAATLAGLFYSGPRTLAPSGGVFGGLLPRWLGRPPLDAGHCFPATLHYTCATGGSCPVGLD
jgi:hypothetical protein